MLTTLEKNLDYREKNLNTLNKNLIPLKIKFDPSKILVHWRLNQRISKNAIFTIFSQQFHKEILSSKLLLAVISGQKIDFYGRLKLELVKTTHLGFVVKVSWKYCERTTSKKFPKQIQFSPKKPNKMSKCVFGSKLKRQLILLFSLFLLLFMSPTALFGAIHGSHYTISANFYLYLQYF